MKRLDKRGLATTGVIIIAVVITAAIVGVGTYTLTPKDGGAKGEVTSTDVQNYLQEASESDIRNIAQNSIPQSIINELATTGDGEDQITMGWIYYAPVGPESWTTACDAARKWMENEYPWLNTVVRESVTVEDVEDVATSMIEDSGADIIFCNAEYIGLALEELSQQYPDVYFVPEIVGSYKPYGNNFIRANGREYQAIYLAGMIASSLSPNGRIGCVASMPASINYRRINAFTMGARHVDPEAEVHVLWSGEWFNPTTERELATTLIEDRNVSVLWEVTDSQSPVRVASEAGIPFIGKSLDYVRAGWATEEEVAVCYEMRWEVILDEVLKDYLAGGYPQPIHFPGMDEILYTEIDNRSICDLRQNGRVGTNAISPHWRDNVADDVVEEVSNLREQMRRGVWDPFMQEVVDRDGNVQSPEGEMPSINHLLTMDYFVEGVVGPLK